MEAGKLRHRLTIQEKSVSQNTYGEEEITWTTFATVWGSIEPLRGQEFLEGRQLQEELTARVRIRYRENVVPAMRISWNSRIFEIEAVINPFERDREMQLMVREIN